MLNNVSLVGRLTKKPEARGTIARSSLAIDTGKDETSFIDVVFFGKTAENVIKFVNKGDMIGVSGYLHQNKYTAKDGTTRSSIEVNVNDVAFLSSKKEEPADPKTEELPDDELPFKEGNNEAPKGEIIPEGYIKGADGKLYKVAK